MVKSQIVTSDLSSPFRDLSSPLEKIDRPGPGGRIAGLLVAPGSWWQTTRRPLGGEFVPAPVRGGGAPELSRAAPAPRVPVGNTRNALDRTRARGVGN